MDNYAHKGFIKILIGDIEGGNGGKGGGACKGGGAEVERARGTMEAGAFGQRGIWADDEYIYTPPHTIPPLPLSFCSKDTPIHDNTPKNFYPIKNASLSQRFPPLPITLCRPQQSFQLC